MTSPRSKTSNHVRGRPKNFDRSAVLQNAMKLFWERGYEGTSFDDLIGVMGISASSFYNAFGSKERLFQEAIDAYMVAAGKWFASELNAEAHTKTAFYRLLMAATREFTRNDLPTGCMVSLACTQVSPKLTCLRDTMARHREAAQSAMAARIQHGINQGDVPKDTDVQALAAFYSALSRGLAIQARDGASREQLQEIVDISMRAWPTATSEAQIKLQDLT